MLLCVSFWPLLRAARSPHHSFVRSPAGPQRSRIRDILAVIEGVASASPQAASPEQMKRTCKWYKARRRKIAGTALRGGATDADGIMNRVSLGLDVCARCAKCEHMLPLTPRFFSRDVLRCIRRDSKHFLCLACDGGTVPRNAPRAESKHSFCHGTIATQCSRNLQSNIIQ